MLKPKSIDIEKVNIYLTAILLFFTPLIFTSLTYEEYEFPKTVFLYLLGGLIGFINLAHIFISGKKIVLPQKWVFVFFAVYFVSACVSTHIHTSFWGYYTRFFGGFFSVFILFGVYFALINNRYFRDFSQLLLRTVCLSVIPISAHALIEYVRGEVRVPGTLGQPNWLAAYLGMVLPICFFFYLKAKGWSKLFWLFLLALGFASFWFTFSLSGLLGLIAAVLVFAWLNKKLLLKNRTCVVLALAIFLMIAALNPGVFTQRINDVLIDAKKLITTSFTAYAQDNYALSDTGYIRTGLWKGTADLIFSSPRNILIGTGPETFAYQFPKFRSPELNYSSEWDFILNKPHNYYLELWSNLGVFGLASFIAISFYILKTKNPFAVPALVSFLVSVFFGWPTVATGLMFWFLLAYTDSENTRKELNLSNKPLVRIGGLFVAGISFLLFTGTVTRFLFADLSFMYADEELKAGRVENSTQVISNAIELNPNEPIYYRWRAKSYIASLAEQPANSTPYFKDLAIKDLQKAYNLNPRNLSTLRNSVPVYYFLAVKDFSKPASSDNIDMRYVGETYDYFKMIKNVSPNDVGIYVTLAEYEDKLGFANELENSIKQIEKLRPDLLKWHNSLKNIDLLLRNGSVGF